MWLHLRNRRLLGIKFRRQYSVDQYIIDFYAPELKLAIELDGSVHELPEQKEHDKVRQKYIENYGIRFIRITNDEFLGNPNKTFDKIEREKKSLFYSIHNYLPLLQKLKFLSILLKLNNYASISLYKI